MKSKPSAKSPTSPAKKSKPIKRESIGSQPTSSPYHKKMHGIFSKAGFDITRLCVNRDYSMTSFWLKSGTHPPFIDETEAHAVLLRLLRSRGVVLNQSDNLMVYFDDGKIIGAFTPSLPRSKNVRNSP